MNRVRRLALMLIVALMVSATASCGASGSTPSSAPTKPSPGLGASPSPDAGASPQKAPNYVVRGNLMRSRDKFVTQKTGRVAFLGGSVTNTTWRDKVQEYLTQQFPDTTFDFINAGMNGTPAELGAFRLEEDVFSKGPVDLLFLEFAVNGGSAEAMEGIVRHARALSPDIDIVQMHIAASWFGDGLDKGVLPDTVVVHEQVAAHYGNCSLHLYKEIYDRVKAGEFTWNQFSDDGVHPNEFGSTIYAQFITGFLGMMWSQKDQKAVPYSMPAPMTVAPWEHASLVSYDKATATNGFAAVDDFMPAQNNGNLKKPISFVASSTPGSTISFSFQGTIVGLYTAVAGDSAIVDYQIDGAAWAELDTSHDSWSPSDWWRMAGFVITTSLADGPHTITFRTKAGAGKTFRVYRLMVG